jgi:hypothetical protein
LFRAYDPELNTIHYGGFDVHATGKVTVMPEVVSENIIVTQYIGIEDVDGNKIFEGDIVESTEGELSGEIWQVVREVCDDFNGWSVQPSDRPRVIGNIYQNEELLP